MSLLGYELVLGLRELIAVLLALSIILDVAVIRAVSTRGVVGG